MKKRTLLAAEALKKAFLFLPNEDLASLFDWMFERIANISFDCEFEEELRESAGQYWNEEEGEWSETNSNWLKNEIENQTLKEFFHGLGSLPIYAEIYESNPINNKDFLADEHKFAELIISCTLKSEKPFILIMTKIESIGLLG